MRVFLSYHTSGSMYTVQGVRLSLKTCVARFVWLCEAVLWLCEAVLRLCEAVLWLSLVIAGHTCADVLIVLY